VNILPVIRGLLAILAIVGLAIGPAVSPAMAMPPPMHAGAASEAMVEEAALAMPEDMPCCPKKSPIPGRGKDCPFMAVCATQFLCNAAQGAGLVLPHGLGTILFPGNDTRLASLSQGPPPRPPKI
jgi:hypothetical protein